MELSDKAYRYAKDVMDLPNTSIHGLGPQFVRNFIARGMAPVRSELRSNRVSGASNVMGRMGEGTFTGQYGKSEALAASKALGQYADLSSQGQGISDQVARQAQSNWMGVLTDIDNRTDQVRMQEEMIESQKSSWWEIGMDVAQTVGAFV